MMHIVALFFSFTVFAQDLPSRYTGLLDFVTMAPDQGESGTCLYVASTGAMELFLNRKAGIKDPQPYGKFDLAESYLIHAPEFNSNGRTFWETPLLKFNRKNWAIHIEDWPYNSWNDTEPDNSVWNDRKWEKYPKIKTPEVTVNKLFAIGHRWSTDVLNESHIEKIKNAMWEHKSPVLVNYNDNGFWHVILIVGYDDELPGTCYEISNEQCKGHGSFYVRDHFGMKVEIRDYDWFKHRGNAAFVVKEVE